jgi:hypothetical protein
MGTARIALEWRAGNNRKKTNDLNVMSGQPDGWQQS